MAQGTSALLARLRAGILVIHDKLNLLWALSGGASLLAMQTTTTQAARRRSSAAVRRHIAEQRHACDLAEIAVQKDSRFAAMLLAGCVRDGAKDLKVIFAAAGAPEASSRPRRRP